MYTIKYSDDNFYTGNISNISDINYVDVFNFNCDFATEKSIVSDYTNSSACFCFYKNVGDLLFPTGRYKSSGVSFSNKTFYNDFDINHNLDIMSGYKSTFNFLGPSEVLISFNGNFGIKVTFIDVYNPVFSFWVYVDDSNLYIKNNESTLYSCFLQEAGFSFKFYNGKLIINSETIYITDSYFLPYNFFIYGNFENININSECFIPMILEGTGKVIDDIYGDAYCITAQESDLGYLKSKASNILTQCGGFVFDIAFRAVGNSIPFSISDGAIFDGFSFIMSNPNIWTEIDAVNEIFYGRIVTTSGVITVSGTVSSINNYYFMRCYYKDNKFGIILNGEDIYVDCDCVTISGGYLNIITNNTLIIDSFALYEDKYPTRESYDVILDKYVSVISSTALIKSHEVNKVLFGVDNFYPKDYNYIGTGSGINNVPIIFSNFDYYVGYSIAGGEVCLTSDYFYVSRPPFKEDVYNCFVCENDKTFLTYFSDITVLSRKIVAESFTNYNYINDNFITTNSGLYIRNYSKVFDPISPASVVEFSNIDWVNSLSFGVLLGVESIPVFPNINGTAVDSSGILYIGETTFSGLDINSNDSIYFYFDGFYVLISGSNVGVLASGVITSDYDYMRYFIKNDCETWAFIDKVYISTAQKNIKTLTNKCFDYSLPEYYNLDDSYNELFYNISSNVLSNKIVLYDCAFYDLECSFSSYQDVSISGIFNINNYSFLGISDNFERGFIIERWRLVCDPYGVYICNQPGWIPIYNGGDTYTNFGSITKMFDGNISERICNYGDVLTDSDYFRLQFNEVSFVDSVDVYITSDYINPEDGFSISCDVLAYYDSSWNIVLNNYVSPVLSGTSWPIRHTIIVPPTRCSRIRLNVNSNWDQTVPTEIRPSSFYYYGGTAVCTTSGVTCIHVALDDVLYVYSEYMLEDKFSLSVSGINYYPFNSQLYLRDYSGNECYIKTDWVSSSGCNIIASSLYGDISTSMSGISGTVEYIFSVSRFLDVITLTGYVDACSGTNIYSSYSFSSDCLGLELIFYNKNFPHAVGSGCLFGFEANDYFVNFSSIAVGYKYTALDGTDNLVKTGVGFNTYPPNLFIDKVAGSYVGQSHKACYELTSSGFCLSSDLVDNNISVKTFEQVVGGIQQVSKFNRISLFSDYLFVPTSLYKIYLVGKNQKYTSFSNVSGLVQHGDKVYFYPGNYNVITDKQICIIGVGHSTDIYISIDNASAGITVINCTTTKCNGSGVFNMYNCYVLPWDGGSGGSHVILLYTTSNINFYNCDLYNYSHMSYHDSTALLCKCIVYRSIFDRLHGYYITVVDGSTYSTRGYYGYGPEFNRVRVISGLSHVESVKVLSFYYNFIYNHFPLYNQSAIGSDLCSQFITGEDAYSVYFYGDLKKLNSFSMYLFVQDLDGSMEIKNSSDFVLTINSNDLSCGIHLIMRIYGLAVDMSVPISHSNVFRLAVVAVVFDGGSISIYLNGAKLATKYIIVVDFNDPSSYLDDSILFFDDSKFVCDGNGLLLKGAALYECIDFLLGTHIEEKGSNSSVQIRVNMEFDIFPMLTEYHGITNYYGYSAYSTGVGIYFNTSSYEYKYIYFKANKSCKTYNNITKKYIGTYKIKDVHGNCVNESDTIYISPPRYDSITFSAAKIDNYTFGYCDIIDPYGYVALYLSLPLPAIERSDYCFDASSSIIMLSFDLSALQDIGPNHLICNAYYGYYGVMYNENGIFHKCIECWGRSYFYIEHSSVLNLNNNFTIEFLFTHFDDNGFDGTLLTKGTAAYNIAYCVGISDKHIPYFKWSWEGDNIIYANRQIRIGDITYLCVVIGTNTVSFYINGENAGIKYTDKLTIVNNSERLNIVSGYYSGYHYKKQVCIEELCITSTIKTENEIINTWNKISGGDSAPWIKINNVVVSSDKPIKVSPSDRFIESDGKIDVSKWEYRSYIKPQAEEGLVLDSRLTKKIKSKAISYNVIFDVSIFCEFLEYSINRDWSIKFKYKFISGNYINIIINYVKYDYMYIKCEYYYDGYKNNTMEERLVISPCGIRFFTDYSGYTYAQMGNSGFWYTLWKSPQNLFVETSGWLEVMLNNDDWDSWFVAKLTNFSSKLYCDTISDGVTAQFYDSIPYGRAFYSQIFENVANLTLDNDVFEIDSSFSGDNCIHSLQFINGSLDISHVLTLNNNIFDNVNYDIFNIEILVYLTYDDTKIIDLFPWINIDVKDKYLYVVMRDNDHIITDSISEFFNNYIYIAVSIGNPETVLRINKQVFVYDTNFTKSLPYHFYPIGKNFSGRVVYFCGYYGDFDTTGYNFRVSNLSRYVGFDFCGRKVFGNNMVTSLNPESTIYSYDNPSYLSVLKTIACSLSFGNSLDMKILVNPNMLQAVVFSNIVIRCDYSNLSGKKVTSITVVATEYNVSHSYYDSFGNIGEGSLVFNYNLIGTCYDKKSIFYFNVNKDVLEKILKGTIVLNIKNNETNIITNITVYLNGKLSVNEVYGSSLLV